MYFSRQPLPERAVRELRSLHFSLNTPVVSIENLAVGPSRAAIAVQDLGDGRTSLRLVVRSQRTGELACFSHEDLLEGEANTQIALDGALSFAEGMGFLFDEDAIPELGAEGPREAADAWNDLLGLTHPEPLAEAPAAAQGAAASDAADHDDDELDTEDDGGDDELEVDPEPAADGEPAELWLEELAPSAAAAPAAAAAVAAPVLESKPELAPPPPPVLLTKFRRTAGAGQGARRNGWPIRLLSHF